MDETSVISEGGEYLGDPNEISKKLEKEKMDAEIVAFSEQLNNLFRKDQVLLEQQLIPLNYEVFFDNLRDGIILCKLVNILVPGKIPENSIALNVNWKNADKPGARDLFFIASNNGLALKAAKEIGCSIINIHHEDIFRGSSNLVLAVVWQLIRFYLLRSVNLISRPELVQLLNPKEKLITLVKAKPEEILKRWFNYHLKKAGKNEKINNFGSDVQNCVHWVTLFNQICPIEAKNAQIEKVLEHKDLKKRAEVFLDVAEKLGCRQFTTVNDILRNHERLNLAFTATIFNNYIGLTLQTEEEILRLYKEIEELNKISIKCFQTHEELKNKEEKLRNEFSEAKENLKIIEISVKMAETKIDRSYQPNNIFELKNNKFIENLTLLEQKCIGEDAEVQSLVNAYNDTEDIKKSLVNLMKMNKDNMSQLEGRIKDNEAAISKFRDILSGNGKNVDELKEQLIEKENKVKETTNVLENHIQNTVVLLKEHAENTETELTPIESNIDLEKLNSLIENNEFLIKKYQCLISDKNKESEEQKRKEQKEMEEISEQLIDYLDEGSAEVVDGLDTLKGILELLLEKSKKQDIYIQNQQETIQKKTELNKVFYDKILLIAQQKREKKKGPFKKLKK